METVIEGMDHFHQELSEDATVSWEINAKGDAMISWNIGRALQERDEEKYPVFEIGSSRHCCDYATLPSLTAMIWDRFGPDLFPEMSWFGKKKHARVQVLEEDNQTAARVRVIS